MQIGLTVGPDIPEFPRHAWKLDLSWDLHVTFIKNVWKCSEERGSVCPEVGMGGTVRCELSLVAQTVKNLPAVQETWVGSLVWEDLLEKGMVTHSSILAWRSPWTEEPSWL